MLTCSFIIVFSYSCILHYRDDVIFSTDSNRASIFDVNDDYLTQSRETVEHFAAIIHALIAETSLSKAPYRLHFISIVISWN